VQYIGSFQTGLRVESENPLEEVWSRVALHGSDELLQRTFTHTPALAGLDIKPYVQYAGVRLRQAAEFREAARQATLLTSPLSLYYSFLNLTRACICMHSEVLPSRRHHGLIFESGEDLLSSGAILRPGTFTDYLHEAGYSWRSGKVVSLPDALSRIIEIWTDYAVYGQESLVVPLDVNAYYSGEVVLRIPRTAYDLSKASTDWTSELPSLSGCCTVRSGENSLEATFKVSKRQDASNFCSLRLDPSLLLQADLMSGNRWYLVRQTDPDLVFPRPAYYFVALFILGSIVRYEPELMLDAIAPGSLSGWLLKRVVQASERFFPQLMLNWLEGRTLYF
jgi:hypothetical protein